FVGQNPPGGALIYYSLTKKASAISLKVMDHTGKVVNEFLARPEPGLHEVTWNLSQGRPRSTARGRQAGSGPPPAGGTAGPGRPRATTAARTEEEPPEVPSFFGGGSPLVKPGIYRLVLTVDGTELTQWMRIEADPAEAATIIASPGQEEP